MPATSYIVRSVSVAPHAMPAVKTPCAFLCTSLGGPPNTLSRPEQQMLVQMVDSPFELSVETHSEDGLKGQKEGPLPGTRPTEGIGTQ